MRDAGRAGRAITGLLALVLSTVVAAPVAAADGGETTIFEASAGVDVLAASDDWIAYATRAAAEDERAETSLYVRPADLNGPTALVAQDRAGFPEDVGRVDGAVDGGVVRLRGDWLVYPSGEEYRVRNVADGRRHVLPPPAFRTAGAIELGRDGSVTLICALKPGADDGTGQSIDICQYDEGGELQRRRTFPVPVRYEGRPTEGFADLFTNGRWVFVHDAATGDVRALDMQTGERVDVGRTGMPAAGRLLVIAITDDDLTWIHTPADPDRNSVFARSSLDPKCVDCDEVVFEVEPGVASNITIDQLVEIEPESYVLRLLDADDGTSRLVRVADDGSGIIDELGPPSPTQFEPAFRTATYGIDRADDGRWFAREWRGLGPPGPDTTPPAPITRAAVTDEVGGLAVSWANDVVDTTVTVVRNPGARRATSPADGTVLDGDAGEFLLDDDLGVGQEVTYSLFVRDRNGQTSPAVHATVTRGAAEDVVFVGLPDEQGGGGDPPGGGGGGSPPGGGGGSPPGGGGGNPPGGGGSPQQPPRGLAGPPPPGPRISGATRYATAADIARHQFPDGSERVYVARADDVVDAVAGGALVDGPILLVPRCAALPPEVVEALGDLAPDRVTALGGSGAVCDETLRAAAAVVGAGTSRLQGDSRFGTAAAIARSSFPTGARSTYLARSDNIVDAVAGGALTDGPVLLVPRCGPVPDVVVDALRAIEPGQVVALGGTSAVCDDTLDAAADAIGARTGRLEGADRFATATAIARRAVPSPASNVFLARADDVVDAVAGGVLTQGPVVLVPRCDALPPVVQRYLEDQDGATVTALGGQAAICDDVLVAAIAATG